ncbi:F-box only protein 8 [Cichlidogyrus casuarinus]|uniref:F-box only protein 8 n=1 Tax=Cichlidogyrus casuarinus TaxID=1844966 RepID=A0ABD2QLF2_9PLAT
MGNLTTYIIERNPYVLVPTWYRKRDFNGNTKSEKLWSSKTLDLRKLPPELSLSILSKLNATDLFLASCVWKDLAFDDLLWKNLCFGEWSFMRNFNPRERASMTYRELYLYLDEARLVFNFNSSQGIRYLIEKEVLRDCKEDIAAYLNAASGLCPIQRWHYLEKNSSRKTFSSILSYEVLEEFMKRQNFRRQFLPDALRNLLSRVTSPLGALQPVSVLERLIDKFSERYIQCNPGLPYEKDHVYMICFSLILLSVDLSSPNVKNKMSKREFIRNTRDATGLHDTEFLGLLYDYVYTNGHIAFHEPNQTTCLPVVNPSVIALERLVSVRAY